MKKLITQEYIASCDRYKLIVGEMRFTKKRAIISTVLGSCISVCLYDWENKYGGMNHFVYSGIYNSEIGSLQYGEYSIRALYENFIESNSNPHKIVAHIFGGAHIKNNQISMNASFENIKVARQVLRELNIKIITDDTGGVLARKIKFFTELNEVIVNKFGEVKKEI